MAARPPPALQKSTGLTESVGDDEDHEDYDIDDVPTLSPQDEQREIFSLTASEMAGIESDLRGLSAMFTASCNIAQNSDTCTSIPLAIAQLNTEISRLSPEKTAAYYRAVEICPELVGHERKMIFLEHDNGDSKKAAKRLAQYWETRLEIFGPDRAFLPMTLSGAMKGEAADMISRSIYQISPHCDTAGRPVLCIYASRSNLAEYSVEREFMALWYLLEVIIGEDADLRRKGVVMLMDGRNVPWKWAFSRKGCRYTVMMADALPIHVRAIHLCHLNKVAVYMMPVLKYCIGKDLRLRFRVHPGDMEQVLTSLGGYCLPRDRLPTDIGGDIVVDMNKLILENVRPTQVIPATFAATARTATEATVDSDDSPPKRLRIENPLKRVKKNKKEKKKKKDKRGGNRGRADIRMDKAVSLKIADPDMSLYDALVAAGFVFRDVDFDSDMIDAEGIRLHQRKNNLCRRVRMEKKKREKQLSIVDHANVKDREEQAGSAAVEPLGASSASVKKSGHEHYPPGMESQGEGMKGVAADALLHLMQEPDMKKAITSYIE